MSVIFGTTLLRDRVHQLRAGLDDAVLLGVLADHEAVDVLDEQDRHAESGCSP